MMVEFVADSPPSRSELYFTPILMSDIKSLNWKKLLVNMHDDTIGFGRLLLILTITVIGRPLSVLKSDWLASIAIVFS
jgi:hypothetical protein